MLEDPRPIRDDFPEDTPIASLPSPYQYSLWQKYLDDDRTITPDGYFYGTCPFHQKRKRRKVSAMFNFDRDVMRCLGDPPCHPKRVASLQNVFRAMTVGQF